MAIQPGISKRRLSDPVLNQAVPIETSASDRFAQVGLSILNLCLLLVGIPLVMLGELISWIRALIGVNPDILQGKVVLITGASGGIGETLSKYFYVSGCKLILAARRRNELERVKKSLIDLPMGSNKRVFDPVILELDISDLNSIPSKAKSAIAAHGQVDILVNNAGIISYGPIVDTTMEVEQRIMNVNYFGTLALTKEILREDMLQRKSGHLVFVSSVLGKMTIPNNLAYCASKHAIQCLADGLRGEVSSEGIAVTIASPSYVKTDISVNALTTSGDKYGVVTNEIETGYSPEYVCEKIFKAVLNKDNDVLISPVDHWAATQLRHFLPPLYFYLVKHHAKKVKY